MSLDPSPLQRELTVTRTSWPIAGTFTISRGAKTQAHVVTADITENNHTGHGECVPYARYGETPASVTTQIQQLKPDIEAGLTRLQLQNALPPGAARNALDCALWDLEAKQTDVPVWHLASLAEPKPMTIAYTISLDTPENMGAAALKSAHLPILKLKLGGHGDPERLAAVRKAAPKARLIVDANEAWRENQLTKLIAACHEAGVEMIEQPLPADNDDALKGFPHTVPVCADETAHGLDSLDLVAQRYDAINIKLDKTGGLTEAIALAKAAKSANLKIMIGCMVSTSLSMAPAILLGSNADIVDLDGALLLAHDRNPGVIYQNMKIHPAPAALWG